MRRVRHLQYCFVTDIPDQLADGILYVSTCHSIVLHRCCCGCGSDVVTPLSPLDWSLTFDGETISLYPSIGNWSYPCQSHYWIERSSVKWARNWSRSEIDAARRNAKVHRDSHGAERAVSRTQGALGQSPDRAEERPLLARLRTIWERLTRGRDHPMR